MSAPNFIDYVKFCSRSGAGGPGYLHFNREKHNPNGGPDGGDGGRGGHIILRGNAQMWTLLHLKYRKHIIAEAGERGDAQDRTGASGKDEIIEVPLGTVARKADSGELVCEITEDGQEVILTPGGRGGKGNAFFATSTNRAPDYAQPGEPGIEEWIILELKLLADVGLVGFPNAGKSTLLSVVSAAKPKIGDYPFTTLTPNLGVVAYRDDKSFVMADIPGIIEGAAEGKGLGIRFLRHIERNALLLFLIPADAKDIRNEYDILLGDLRKYNPELLDKKRLLAISKSDMLDDELMTEMKKELPEDLPVVFISSVTQQGIMALKDLIWRNLH
jgi:GTP-binding protein